MESVPASVRTESVTSHGRKKDTTIWGQLRKIGFSSTVVLREKNEPLCRSRLDLILIIATDVEKTRFQQSLKDPSSPASPEASVYKWDQPRPILLKRRLGNIEESEEVSRSTKITTEVHKAYIGAIAADVRILDTNAYENREIDRDHVAALIEGFKSSKTSVSLITPVVQ
ncbi:hypothetical protein Aspvir_009715 [Aspergillus viridinutans]|uniref:Uncharacterized protein n=1 Tax=Aspergillus viridinutans TaxID=75553 RepID=A0A9P3C100_ASPVI|nr:uncharacterized protein Aspvir_009715 [Aspergillus viridinutans]GIK05602.1 hypothetical protein Aspvir_009715 [Aspergillus viridinutans]